MIKYIATSPSIRPSSWVIILYHLVFQEKDFHLQHQQMRGQHILAGGEIIAASSEWKGTACVRGSAPTISKQ